MIFHSRRAKKDCIFCILILLYLWLNLSSFSISVSYCNAIFTALEFRSLDFKEDTKFSQMFHKTQIVKAPRPKMQHIQRKLFLNSSTTFVKKIKESKNETQKSENYFEASRWTIGICVNSMYSFKITFRGYNLFKIFVLHIFKAFIYDFEYIE